MNDQIRQLAEQVGAVRNVLAMGRHDGVLFTEYELEKFAELIVKECVHVAVFKDDGMISTADVAGYMAAGRASAAKIIKEHFGVEE
jgi:hypothetical protein